MWKFATGEMRRWYLEQKQLIAEKGTSKDDLRATERALDSIVQDVKHKAYLMLRFTCTKFENNNTDVINMLKSTFIGPNMIRDKIATVKLLACKRLMGLRMLNQLIQTQQPVGESLIHMISWLTLLHNNDPWHYYHYLDGLSGCGQ